MNSPPSLKSDPSTRAEPNGEGIFQTELSDSARRRARSPLVRGMWLMLFAAGLAIPMTLYWLPSEHAKWRIAAAQAKWLDGDLAGAIQVLDAATSEFSDNAAIYEQRIQFFVESEDFEQALADTERLVKLTPRSEKALQQKGLVLLHLRRHDEAIAVCKEILRLAEDEWIGSAASARNFLAYAQAIGGKELETALEHINESIRLAGDNPAMLDTRSFVYYRLGDSEAARDDIERVVNSMEQSVARLEREWLCGVRSYHTESDRASYQQSLAVMLYHRSLVYDLLKMQDEAKVDRERVRGLGYEPNDQLF